MIEEDTSLRQLCSDLWHALRMIAGTQLISWGIELLPESEFTDKFCQALLDGDILTEDEAELERMIQPRHKKIDK